MKERQKIVVCLDDDERKKFRGNRSVLYYDGNGNYLHVDLLPDGIIEMWSPNGFRFSPLHENKISIALNRKGGDE